MSGLKPCDHCDCAPPFSPRVQSDKTVSWVECPCGMKTAEYRHEIYAIKQWNTRDTSAIEAAVLEKLRIEMDDFDPKDSHVFMAGQIKCIAMLDEALAALRIEKGVRDV